MVDSGKLPHAILLEGDSGIGKLALARAFAQYIHCENKQNGEPCGKCPSCVQHQTFNHADMIFSFPIIKKAGSTSAVTSGDYIDKWREFLTSYRYVSFQRWQKILENENSQPRIYVSESDSIIHKMNMSSYSSDYKILLMWLPEKMNEDCANKLLKIIEEPYPGSMFIFVSDDPKKIISTILSRTQRIQVPKPCTTEIANYLSDRFGIDNSDALSCAAPADGNVVVAEDALTFDDENKEFFECFVAMMRKAYSRDLKALKGISEQICDYKREKSQRFLSYCSRMVRENFTLNIDKSLTYMTTNESAFSAKFSPFINERNAIPLVEELSLAARDIGGNCNSKIVLFDLMLKITKLIRN